MARQKIEEESIRKIQRSKGMYYISIPIELMRKMGWKERQKVVVEEAGKQKLSITDWNPS